MRQAIAVTCSAAFLLIADVGAGNAEAVAKKPPKSCLRALNAAEDGFAGAAAFGEVVSGLFLTLGNTDFLDPVSVQEATTALEDGTAEIENLTTEIGEVAERFNGAKAKCRAGK
ncbi:MAG: hypothetical protein ACRDZ1_00965 [Acidimicrobiia bacterium]